jgi:hypothetical protein
MEFNFTLVVIQRQKLDEMAYVYFIGVVIVIARIKP